MKMLDKRLFIHPCHDHYDCHNEDHQYHNHEDICLTKSSNCAERSVWAPELPENVKKITFMRVNMMLLMMMMAIIAMMQMTMRTFFLLQKDNEGDINVITHGYNYQSFYR